MSLRDLIEGEAMLDDEENDEDVPEDFDGEDEDAPRRPHEFNDSSEEDEEEDDDEEARRAVQEGFIDDDDEEIEQRKSHRRERKQKRAREEEHLDEEDLELIGEHVPGLQRGSASEIASLSTPQGIDDIFNSDDDEDTAAAQPYRGRPRDNEMDGFITEDSFSDEEGQREQDDLEVAPPARPHAYGIGASEAAGLDENALEDMRAAFGDGSDYRFALDFEEEEDEVNQDESRKLDLKDVFDPSELAERMLTEEDNEIRAIDEPERHQVARKPYKHVVLTEDQFREEAIWISGLMLLKKRLDPELHEPFQRSVAKMLEFLVTDDWEVPFIFQHRKDYMIHAVKEPANGTGPDDGSTQYNIRAERLLNMTDLWDIFDYDLKFRALVDKRNTIQKAYDGLKSLFSVEDANAEELLTTAATMEELQDVQDYIHFQYATQLRDMANLNGEANGENHRRKTSSKSIYERVRNAKAYGLVRAFGISANDFADNAAKQNRRKYTEDPSEGPEELADQFVDADFSNSSHVLQAAKSMFAEELVMSPKMRKVVRQSYYMNGVVDCFRTEKGLRRIDEQHPYYEFKYLRNQQLSDIARRPEMFLRMLKAEEEGLVEVRVADAWNRLRRDVLDMALSKLERFINRSVKENIRQDSVQTQGMVLGTVPRVLALSTGFGIVGREPIFWAFIEEDGRVLENGQLFHLDVGDAGRGIKDGESVSTFLDICHRRKPDVIAVSGMTPETRRLYKLVSEVVELKDIRGPTYQDEDENGDTKDVSDRLEVVIVNDEVARLYQNSPRASQDNPSFQPMTNYCVALGHYLQSPLKEYASLGRDIVSIQFKPGQQLISQDLLIKQLETALVDMVNLVGVELTEAIHDPLTANLLPYVCGLGPRKAAHMLQMIHQGGGHINNRVELIGINSQYPAMGIKVWNNCASFLYIDYENADPDADPLDNTRVHPEDYDIARKMAADALELDEEDIKAETDENGSGAIVRKLFRDEQQDRVNDLILEEYAEQLEKNLNQRKRATLETIRAELQQPYEELRKQFLFLGTEDVFTMLTGETQHSLKDGMVVPIAIKRVFDDHIDAKLDCGIDALVSETELGVPYDVPVRSVYQPHQTVPAKILFLNKKSFTCNVSLREDQVSQPVHRNPNHGFGDWDEAQERKDRESQREKIQHTGQAIRVIKHPLFHPFNSTQAEEYLGSRSRGDVVIRPSSRGPDHLAVTWKVAHVLRGRVLKVGGRYTYSDLDDLIVNHVKAMAKKVDEMMLHEKFQDGSKSETDQWLETYTKANPRRSAYAFCINTKYPGYFFLCFKAGERSRLQNWPVKVIPQGFELQKNPYPDMQALCNGFKLMFTNMQAQRR
ncbi:Transcription elongation factor spt6 [Penicillium chermesinum]|nr:Transcription elongation factor spt6 [Penicillium chermesinum]